MGGHLLQIAQLQKLWQAPGASFELNVPRFEVKQGAALALVGESGSGKSTFLDLLALALAPDAGERFLLEPGAEGGHDVLALWAARSVDELARLRRAHLGYVLQLGGLLPALSVRENIALPRALVGLPDDDEVVELAESLGIRAQLAKRPEQLSVGERQRAAIARALSHHPRLILADEPTASIDPLRAESVLELLVSRTRERGITLIVATHAWQLAEKVGLEPISHRLVRTGETARSEFWRNG